MRQRYVNRFPCIPLVSCGWILCCLWIRPIIQEQQYSFLWVDLRFRSCFASTDLNISIKVYTLIPSSAFNQLATYSTIFFSSYSLVNLANTKIFCICQLFLFLHFKALSIYIFNETNFITTKKKKYSYLSFSLLS